MRDRQRSAFKAGLVLEAAVCDGLTQLGVAHRRTLHRGHEDVEDQLDLIVSPGGGRPNLEIQLTLRPKLHSKIFTFASRALTTATRGIRLYIEVVGSHRDSADLKMVGWRVAKAIKTIARHFRDFGAARLLGLRIHALSAKIEKFDLVEFCGRKLRKILDAWQEEQRRLEEVREAQKVALQEYLRAPRPAPFWHDFLRQIPATSPPLAPTRASYSIDTRRFFMPRRLC